MTDIQRYQFYPMQKDKVQECVTGFWVKHEDHIKAMDNKEDVINSLWETFITIAKKLDINLEKAKSHEGNPSDVFIEYIEAQAKEIERLTTGIKEVLIELQELEQSGRDSFEAYEKLQELIK